MAGTRFRSGQLAALRAVAGLRRVRLAELVEVRESTVGQWERGAASPSAGKVPRLAHALGVPPLQLYEVPPGAPSFRALRLTAGLTLMDLVTRSGVCYATCNRLDRGRGTAPEPRSLAALAAALGLPAGSVTQALVRSKADPEV